MPIHDWTKVPAGIFHAFHHRWISEIGDALNTGILPADYYALPEQMAAGRLTDVLALRSPGPDPTNGETRQRTSTAVASAPRTAFVLEADLDAELYRRKKSSVFVRHVSGDDVVAVIEIVSPGNKGSQHALTTFVDKAWELIERGIHLLIVDLLPPGRRDPQGIHAAIWDNVSSIPLELPEDRPLTLVAYEACLPTRAYVEPTAVGRILPPMPLFLAPDLNVAVPLEETYQAVWERTPVRVRHMLEE